MNRPDQGLSSLAPGGGKMRDPGNEVENAYCNEIALTKFGTALYPPYMVHLPNLYKLFQSVLISVR